MSRDLVAMTTPWDGALVMMVDDESMMPGVSGFDVLQAVRADEALQYTPVIVLTAASDPATKLRALELGATEFLSKPVDSSELVLRVRNTLAFKRYQDRLAYVDMVTGLSNPERFTRRLDEALQHALPQQAMLGLLHLGCEQFRQTRETLGLARVDSQDFALILPEVTQAEDAATLAKLVIQELAAPFQIDGHDIFLVPHIGIALAPSDGQTANGLLKSADLACSKVKGHGKSGYEFFSAELTARSIERLTLTNQLRLAYPPR